MTTDSLSAYNSLHESCKTTRGSRENWTSSPRSVGMRIKEPHAEVIGDIASGLNFKWKELKAILERCLQGNKFKIVVAHRDRLARFGFELIEWLIERNGGKVVVLSQSHHTYRTDELLQDLRAILSIFAARRHRLRKYRDKITQDQTLSDSGATGNDS